jgi:hypothetical protein
MATTPKKPNQRSAPRYAITPRGEILDGLTLVKVQVLIQDISDNGLSLVCSREFEPGQILDLKLQLSPSATVECKVEVRHSSDVGTGTKIVSMDDKNRRMYDQYLQEFFSQRLG